MTDRNFCVSSCKLDNEGLDELVNKDHCWGRGKVSVGSGLKEAGTRTLQAVSVKEFKIDISDLLMLIICSCLMI